MPKPTPTTVAELRAQLDASRARALAQFERDWGTRDARVVAEALRAAIPDSASPGDAAARALALLGGRAASC